MNIDSLGGETIVQLYNAKILNNIADIYTISKEQLLTLERMAEKSATNLITGIEASKKFHSNVFYMQSELDMLVKLQQKNS